MTPYIVSTTGLLFDILGAFLVAIEVVKQYEGEQFRNIGVLSDLNGKPLKTPEFESWEFSKYKYMKIGLSCLSIGFILQGIGLWLGYLSSAQSLCK